MSLKGPDMQLVMTSVYSLSPIPSILLLPTEPSFVAGVLSFELFIFFKLDDFIVGFLGYL